MEKGKSLLKCTIAVLLSMAMILMLVPGFAMKADAAGGDYEAALVTESGEVKKEYETLEEALEAVGDEDVVKLYKDVTISRDETFTIGNGSTSYVAIDLNGHTLNNKGTIVGEFRVNIVFPKLAVPAGISGRVSFTSVEFINNGTKSGLLKNSGTINANIATAGSSSQGIIMDITGGEVNGKVDFYGGTLYISGGEFNSQLNIYNDGYEGIDAVICGKAKISNFDYYVSDGGINVTFAKDIEEDDDDDDPVPEDECYLSLLGGYYTKHPLECIGGPAIGEGDYEDYFYCNEVEEYDDQEDWEADYTVYKYRIVDDEYEEEFDIEDADVKGIPDQTYTGKPITPALEVIYEDEKLIEGTDYEVFWKDNVEVGTATAQIVGKGVFEGSMKVTFEIVAPKTVSIEDAQVTVADQTYTGKPITPALTVKLGTTDLKQGTDFDVAWANNIDAGTATATITGKGSFTGSKKVTFNINKVANTLKVSKKKSKVKFANVKKAKQVVKKSIKVVDKGQGKLTYKKVKVNKKKFNKYFKVNKKTGKITIKKGLKKGTYKVTISVTARGDQNHNNVTKKAVATIVVK